MFDEFYGLTGRPFQLTPDPSFYFESISHRKALSYLGYGMAQGEGFIVITGEVGAGKSTLVAHLMQKIDHERMTVGQVVTSNLDGEELVHVAANSFGLDVAGHDKAAALSAIEAFLHGEAREGRRCLLVVDESQNLSIEALEELRMLSNFQLGAHPLLQVLLLGQPEFRKVLAEHGELEQLRQRVIASHHLEAMEPYEIEPYIRHRLECVGWEGNPEFAEGVFGEIHGATGGIPRRVNQVVTRLLLLGAIEQSTILDQPMLASVLDEMANDNAFHGEAADAAMQELAVPAPGPVKHAARASEPLPHAAPAISAAMLADMLAERDAQIAELQQAVVELAGADQGQTVVPDTAELEARLNARIDTMQARLEEQERTVRHVLTMLIEWIETGEKPREAA
ncbi:XrtA/PEP-CTERM system-associated ATPase [Allopontixanthobacter sediminis]|uniref:AAA family ATPase n=1 Tax=Allopontixanthobacter sediminis TaxID=1689985 RepID=A0A845AZU6_9SPHN|nr:XrtA/PEP-CTERM system-associated ATPase [Allopontixanthobacter sediminis]MXP43488.1 AAA family ATPase [Allopontixanthobacter sediminis]